MSWTKLTAGKGVGRSFTTGTYTMSYFRLWVRKNGTPSTLTFRFYSDAYTTLEQTVTITSDDVEDVSKFQLFQMSGTENVSSAGGNYYIAITCETTDNDNNCWEIGGYTGAGYTYDGATWTVTSDWTPFYYGSAADTDRVWFSFFLDDAMYIVDSKASGSASNLYINGDRGKATSATSTTIVQTGKTWTVDRWIGAYVKIIRGTGKGQVRLITDNDATSLTVATWTVTPSTDSEYIIYGTEWWTEVGTTGLGAVTGKPVVVNQIVYFPQGASDPVRWMVWNPATPAHAFGDDGPNYADLIESFQNSNVTYLMKALSALSISFSSVIDLLPQDS